MGFQPSDEHFRDGGLACAAYSDIAYADGRDRTPVHLFHTFVIQKVAQTESPVVWSEYNAVNHSCQRSGTVLGAGAIVILKGR